MGKWRGLPELSLIKPLCEELNISINELLSGEKLNKKEYQEKLEENILSTIDYTNKKIRSTKKRFKLILSVIIIFVTTHITLFTIDINQMRNNKPVFFSTRGFDYVPPINLDTEVITMEIEDYIVTKGDKTKRYENEKTFVAIKTYLVDEKKENKLYHVYTWVLEETYYSENNQIKQNSVSSIPYKFIIEKINNKFKVTKYKIPRDGSFYEEDIKNIFPRSVVNDINHVHQDGAMEKLQLDIEKQINLYFHK